ncbi:MAG: integral membrane channel [Lasallia pustulata]|uniref:Integral membrane channel n=1 Tax=Lasallia pustulata TaxID=136370 RepID=A0A5M8PEI1_9LECA|nr:MAG: integral membrane channel [Lasallia pustulata]
MLSYLLKPKKAVRHRGDRSPFSSPYAGGASSSPLLGPTHGELEDHRRPAADYHGERAEEHDATGESDVDAEEDEDEADEDGGLGSPLLPIFSAAHLDALPVYNLTHTIRLLVVPRCETTLSWDQLRSPQVSQFLVKPIQQQILTSHLTRATLYALMANCLQFKKEVQMNPGNSGTSKTRAMICELLAIKMLKEFSTRELIDALSYDFFPLQGMVPSNSGQGTPQAKWEMSPVTKWQPRAARVSTLEVAIRAQAKRFLAHPLVVQQLEAIWAGRIVFHSSADNLHRSPYKVRFGGYGAIGSSVTAIHASPDRLQPAKQRDHSELATITVRRSVTLYDPHDASLFKLSRLRVPRYRQFLSTCSLAVLLGLYLAVLLQRSLHISTLEVLFWFWSAGFMLDEIVGFNEQGFSLYIMSFWNMFDLGILLLLMCYYGMRLYGILMPDVRKHHVAGMAYDVLAANAVLLFPRLFSVLDHYRYFSQLLIAFRMMALDLIAVFVLILISCSGFFVAFTLSFGDDDDDTAGVAYALFQMLMGFSPAAWAYWDKFNPLGRVVLTLFLFITHFLIITILITVLTNSFMAVVQNANEEHQFVFAVNAISMVKSDALFSYIAPTNIIAWLLAPLRYILPFRQFVRVNRTVIKITHFPVLFLIYLYERIFLVGGPLEPTEVIEQRGRPGKVGRLKALEAPGARVNLFSPSTSRLREPSVATYHKDRALDEVFRRPFRDNTIRGTRKSQERRKTSNVVDHWMQNLGLIGEASPPMEQDHSIVERLETPRPLSRRSHLSRRRQTRAGRNFTEASRSVASDPEGFTTTDVTPRPTKSRLNTGLSLGTDDLPQQTSADGDDELPTNDEDENVPLDKKNRKDYFQHSPTAKPKTSFRTKPVTSSYHAAFASLPYQSITPTEVQRTPRGPHNRNTSTNTILYNPFREVAGGSSSTPPRKPVTARNSIKNSGTASGTMTPASAGGRRTPRRLLKSGVQPRPIMPPRGALQSAPNLEGMVAMDTRPRNSRRSTFALELGSDIGDNKAIGGGFVGAVPSSFQTQMAFATGAIGTGQVAGSGSDDQRMMGRLMLARMNTLEEGFREILQEVKDWRKVDARASQGDHRGSNGGRPSKKSGKEGKMKARSEDDWIDDKEESEDLHGTSI